MPRKPALWTLLLCAFLILSSASAQGFSINLQGGVGPANIGGRGQLEASFQATPGLSFGARLGVQNTPLGDIVEISLSPFALYRFFIFGDGQWYFTGYAGAQAGVYYSPNRPSSTVTPPVGDDGDDNGGGGNSGSGNSGKGSANSGSGSSDDSAERRDDNRRRGRDPRGDDAFKPTQTLEFTALGLGGVDGAYFIDERWSVYFGLEVNLRALPIVEPVAFPYAEVDYLLLDNLTAAVGAYLNLRPSAQAYWIYANLFYDLTRALGLRLEVAYSGSFSGYLRLTIRL